MCGVGLEDRMWNGDGGQSVEWAGGHCVEWSDLGDCVWSGLLGPCVQVGWRKVWKVGFKDPFGDRHETCMWTGQEYCVKLCGEICVECAGGWCVGWG